MIRFNEISDDVKNRVLYRFHISALTSEINQNLMRYELPLEDVRDIILHLESIVDSFTSHDVSSNTDD